MGAWTVFTLAGVLNALPTDLAALYAKWIDANPAKANRLSELVDEQVAAFRETVATQPENVLDLALNTVPTTGYRHALTLVIFSLGMEMGVQFAPEVYSLVSRADIWLRMVQSGTLHPLAFDGSLGTPSYRRFLGDWRMRRCLRSVPGLV